MNEIPAINARLRKVIDEKYFGNVSSFAESIGVVPQKVNRLFNIDRRTGKYPLLNKTDIIDRLQALNNDINISWLLTGEGEMIKMEGKSLEETATVRKSITSYNKKDTVTQISNDNYMEVEFRDLSVAGGPLNMTEARSSRKTMLVPREYEKGEYLVVRVDGPSMDDGTIYSIPSGANILIRRLYLENGEKLPIRDNLFVIDAKDGQALKQIIEHNTEEGYVICHSYNPDFTDYRVDLEDVFGFYIFRKIVGFRPPVRGI